METMGVKVGPGAKINAERHTNGNHSANPKGLVCPDCKGTGHCKCTNPQLKARIKKDDHGRCTPCQGSEKCQLCCGTGFIAY